MRKNGRNDEKFRKKSPEKLKFFSGFNAGSLKVIMWTRICDGKKGVKNRGATGKNRTVKTGFDRNIRFLYIFGLPRGIGFCGHVQKFAGFWLIVTEQKCVTNSRYFIHLLYLTLSCFMYYSNLPCKRSDLDICK